MAQRRSRLVQQGIQYAIAFALSVGILTNVRREVRIPSGGVPGVFAEPGTVAASPPRSDATVSGGEVVEERSAATEVRQTVKEAQRGFLGFDTHVYPGDDAMQKWRESSPYQWVGYYLPAPCHKDDSWSGTRETLERMGWGIAVIYVGQQVWGGIPATPGMTYITRRIRAGGTKRKPKYRTVREQRRVPISDCSAARISAAQGRLEADDAIAKTQAEGFPTGTVIYLDLERVEVMPQLYREYYIAWTDRVLEDGRFHVGAYAHAHNAAMIYEDMKGVFAKYGVTEEPHMWVAKGRGFHPAAIPEEVGHAFAMAWQGVLDVTRRYAGIKLPIDENVSDRPNPSAPTSTAPGAVPATVD